MVASLAVNVQWRDDLLPAFRGVEKQKPLQLLLRESDLPSHIILEVRQPQLQGLVSNRLLVFWPDYLAQACRPVEIALCECPQLQC